MKESNKNSILHKYKWLFPFYFSLFIIYIIALINWRVEILRFESPLANYFTFLLCLAIPIFQIILAFWFSNWGFKILGAIVPLLLIPISLFLGYFSLLMFMDILSTGADPSFERIESVKLNNSQITLYRTNGGATTSFGLAIRHEKTVLPGILLVKRIESFYPAYDAKINSLGKNEIKVVVAPYSSDQTEKISTLNLKRWVYF